MSKDPLLDYIEKYEASDEGALFAGKDYTWGVVDFFKNKARTLNYFKQEGLMPEREKKAKFSFIDLVWLRIIYQLRDIGVNLDLLRKLKEMAFATFDTKYLSEIMLENEKAYKQKLRELLVNIPEEFQEACLKEFDAGVREGTLAKKYIKSNLSFWIAAVIMNKAPGEIHLYPDGTVEFYSLDNDRMPMKSFVHKTYISISLTEILSYYLSKEWISKVLLENYFTPDEILILATVRKEKCKSIKIKYNDELIDLIETEKEIKIEIGQRLSEILLHGSYEDVTIKTQKGKIYTCRRITKIKPKENRH